MPPPPPSITLFPYTTLFRSGKNASSKDARVNSPAWSKCSRKSSPKANARSSSPNILKWVSSSRSEEHTSELQSRGHLVCRLLLEKKNKTRLKDREKTKQT